MVELKYEIGNRVCIERYTSDERVRARMRELSAVPSFTTREVPDPFDILGASPFAELSRDSVRLSRTPEMMVEAFEEISRLLSECFGFRQYRYCYAGTEVLVNHEREVDVEAFYAAHLPQQGEVK
jgi:hypothetical protein